jgi:hypothetical protein
MGAWSPSELHKRYKTGVTRVPLALAVNNQPMNAGIAVDVWGRSSLAGGYAADEAAGTHAVTLPAQRRPRTADRRAPRRRRLRLLRPPDPPPRPRGNGLLRAGLGMFLSGAELRDGCRALSADRPITIVWASNQAGVTTAATPQPDCRAAVRPLPAVPCG